MTLHIKTTRLLFRQAGLIFLLLCMSSLILAQVNVTVSNQTGVNGQEVLAYVTADPALGQDVYSFQLKLQMDSSILQVRQVTKGSSLPAGWSVPLVNQTGNITSIATYGTTAITAGNQLLVLRIGLIGTADILQPITLQQFVFNEGNPSVSLHSGAVQCQNRIPYLDAVDAITAYEFDEISYDLTGHDPLSLPLTITALNPPAGAVLDVVNPTTSHLSWTPGFTQAGQYTLNYGVYNSDGYGDTLSVSVNVQDRVVVSIPFTTCQPGAYVNVPIYAQDLTGQQVYSVFSRIAYDPAKLTYHSIVQTGSLTSGWSAPAVTNSNGLLTMSFYGTTPLTGSGNLFYIRLTAIGELHTNAPLHFQTFLLNEGTPTSETTDGNVFIGGPEPWIDPIAALNVNESALVEFVITAHDPQMLPLSITAFGLPEGAVLQSTGYGSSRLSWQTDYFDTGSYLLSLVATNSNLLADTLTVQVVVNNVPRPPYVQNPVSTLSFAEDTIYNSLNLNNVFIDSDLQVGDVLTFSYSGNLHIGVSIQNGIVTMTPQADWHGQETITFTATDLAMNAVFNVIAVTVNAVNDAPRVAVSLSDITLTEDNAGTTVNLQTHFFEPDGDAISYRVSGNAHAAISFDQHTLLLIPQPNWFGTEQITITATETGTPNLYAVSDVFTLTVLPVNDAPVILASVPYITIYYNTVYTSNPLSNYFGDIDSQLQYTFSGYQHLQITLNPSGQMVITPEQNWYGITYLTITATDDSLQSVAQTVRVSAIRDFVVTEDFNHAGALPASWVRSPSTGTNIWSPKVDTAPDYSMEVNTPVTGSTQRLTSLAYNLSLYKNIQTSFYYNLSGSALNAIFQYSLNNLTYVNIGTLTAGTSGFVTFAVPAAQQQASIRFRWSYISNSGLPNYWNIDDFQITGEYGDFTKPTTITDLAVTNSNVNQVTLHWTPCTEAYFDRYEIVYSLNSSFDAQDPVWSYTQDAAMRFISTSQTTITGLQRDTQYWFMVRGVDMSENIGLNSNTVTVLLNQRPAFITPLPVQPPTAYSNSRIVSIGITAADDVLLNASSLQYRIDANGNGSYDPEETWSYVSGYTNTDVMNISVNAAYQTDGEQLAFEFRIMDTIGLGYVYSGATQTEGIIDDYLVMIDTIAPTIITDLQTLAVTTTTATLSWSPVTENHFAGYVVYYEASPGITNQNQVWTQAEDAALGNINTSQTTITGLMSGQRYWFRILARDAAGNAAELSNEVTNIANSTYPLFSSPVPAQNGQYHNTRTLTIGATVYDAYGIDQTHVEYRFDRNGNGSYDASETWQQVPSIQISRQEETLLLSAPAAFDVDGEHLCYEFRTWDIDGYGPAYSGTNAAMGISDDWFVSIDTSYPAAIPTLVIGVTTESSVQLAWAASSDNHFRRYEVYYATHPAVTAADSLWTDTDDASLSNSGSGLIATDVTNLPASTRFYFRVRAVDIAGNATWSDEVSAVTVGLYAPAAPTGIWVEVSGEDVILHWDAVSTDTNGNPLPVTGYNVYAAVMPDFTADLGSFIDFTAETSYTFSGIALEASLTNVFFKVTTVYQP